MSQTSKDLLKQMTKDYYDGLFTAKESGKKVVWSSSVTAQEFFEAMDMEVAYPENHAAAIGAKNGAPEMLAHAEALGYNMDLCSYARINLAYADLMESDILNMPRPDIVVCTSNICNQLIKWYENLANIFDVPYVLIDAPFNIEYEVTENTIEYIKCQFKELVRQLEIVCGKPFNYEKFDQVMEISSRAVDAWMRATDYASNKPSPLDGFNLFNYMGMAVCMRGKESSVELFDSISDEMEEMIKNDESQFKGEQQHRVMWEGLAVWPYLSHNYKTLKNHNVIVTGSAYPASWNLRYDVGDIAAMAECYAGPPVNFNIERQANYRLSLLNQFKCDGTIYHINRSCKFMDFMQVTLRKLVFEKTGKPYVVFDGDQCDPSNFATAQFETRIQALVENMEAHKNSQAKEDA